MVIGSTFRGEFTINGGAGGIHSGSIDITSDYAETKIAGDYANMLSSKGTATSSGFISVNNMNDNVSGVSRIMNFNTSLANGGSSEGMN